MSMGYAMLITSGLPVTRPESAARDKSRSITMHPVEVFAEPLNFSLHPSSK